MKKAIIKTLCLLSAIISINALAHGPHVHGTGELHVAVEGDHLDIELHSPLDNLLGFEHAPATDAQRTAVSAMVAKLNKPLTLFRLPDAASCKAGAVQIDSPLTPVARVSGAAAAAPAHEDDGDDHADLTAEFGFTCAHIEKLGFVDVALFGAFPGTHTIKAEIIGMHGQSAATLTAEHPRIVF